MKSAVQSANTVIFVPSSLDFIRVQNHLRKINASFTVLSEYSSNQDISRVSPNLLYPARIADMHCALLDGEAMALAIVRLTTLAT